MRQFDAILKGLGFSSLFFFLGRSSVLFDQTGHILTSIGTAFGSTLALLVPISGLFFLIWWLAASSRLRVTVWQIMVFGALVSTFLSWFWTRYFLPLPWEASLWAEAFWGACLALVAWYGSFGWAGAVRLQIRETDPNN